jgi:hypothetical protein
MTMTDKERLLQFLDRLEAISDELDDFGWRKLEVKMLSKSDLFLANYLAYKDLPKLNAELDQIIQRRDTLKKEYDDEKRRLGLDQRF